MEVFLSDDDELQVAITRSCLISVLIDIGDFNRARNEAALARATFLSLQDSLRLSRLDVNEGNIAFKQDRFGDAEFLWQRALGTLLTQGTRSDVFHCLVNLGCSKVQTGRVPEALRLFQKAELASRDQRDKQRELVISYNRAWALMHWGHHSEALRQMMELQRTFQQRHLHYYEALCLLANGQILLEYSLHRDARAQLSAALAIFDSCGTPYERAKTLFFLAVCSQLSGRSESAMSMLAEASQCFANLENDAWLQRIRIQEGQILLTTGHCEEAYERALLSRGSCPKPCTADIAALLSLLKAQCHLANGQFQDAYDESRDLLPSVTLLDREHLEIEIFWLIGRAAEGLKLEDEARTAYLQAAELIESICESLPPLDLRGGFLAGKTDVFHYLFLQAQRRGNLSEVFSAIERSKAIGFHYFSHDAFWQPHPFKKSNQPGDFAVETQELRRLSSRLRELRTTDNPPARDAANDDQGRALERKTLETLRYLGLRTHKRKAATYPSLGQLKAGIGEDSTVLQYHLARGSLWCLSVTHDGANLFRLGDAAPALQALDLLRLALAGAREDQSANSLVRANYHLSVLYDILVLPLEETLRSTIVVIPEGRLACVPFHALRSPNGHHVIDEHAVSTAPSTQCLLDGARLPATSVTQSLVVGAADRAAPRIAKEALRLAERLPGATLLLNSEATSSRVIGLVGRSDLVHIASHGSFRRERPLLSTIHLADGPFFLHDLVGQDLSNAELVVLSGCNMGKEPTGRTGQLQAWPHFLLASGARAVVSALWKVDDEAGLRTMEHLYDNLLAGRSKVESLRRACLLVRRTHPHPYFWAPFILCGSTRPLNIETMSKTEAGG